MDVWQISGAKDMKALLLSVPDVEKVEIKGSLIDYDSLDKFSDVDLNVILRKNSTIGLTEFLTNVLPQIGTIFGYQLCQNGKEYLLRACYDNGWRFDIVFLYLTDERAKLTTDVPECKIVNILNEFWFLSSMVLAKLGRCDYLVASHLVLELCQLIIVIQMLERDKQKSTNIHRFGDKEEVPVLLSFANIKVNTVMHENNTKSILLDILFIAAEEIDKTVKYFGIEYQLKCCKLKELYELLS